MKRLLLIIAICFVTAPVFGDEQPDWNKIWDQILVTGKVPSVQPVEMEQPKQPSRREEQQLLPPYFAKKYLRGDAWTAWAIEHNRREAEGIEWKRSELILTDSGMMIRDRQGIRTASSILIYDGQRRRTPPRFWRFPQSGGPVIIYNPYCPPRNVD